MPPEAREKVIRKLTEMTLFIGMTDGQLHQAVDAMRSRSYAAKSNFITRGDMGDSFFILESGTWCVHIA